MYKTALSLKNEYRATELNGRNLVLNELTRASLLAIGWDICAGNVDHRSRYSTEVPFSLL